MTMEPEAPLGRRIADIAFPEADTLAARVIERYRRAQPAARRASFAVARRRRLVPAAAVAAVLLGVMLAASGLGTALASSVLSPAMARVLSTLGLSAERDVTPLLVSATSSGQTVSVLGGYADSTRTVLAIQVTPSNAVPLAPTLTDGTGATLGNGDTSIVGSLVFPPLAHPVAGPNPLTLHIDTLVEVAAGKGPDELQMKGSWTLRFALPYEADAAPVPSPGRLGAATVTFTGVAVSSSSVHVRFRVEGPTMAELVGRPQSQSTAIRYELLDPLGRSMGNMMQGNPSGKGAGQEASTAVEWDVLYHRRGPGTYHLVLTWNGSRLVRDIQVG